jgi:pyruvate formate lyase activating enzyme
MEALIFDIKRFAIHDGPGVRTTVFMKGCPLSCLWCHNPESQNSNIETYQANKPLGNQSVIKKQQVGNYITLDKLMSDIERDRIYYEESGGGITFSGGEPLQQIDFIEQALNRCKEIDLHTTVDTSGHVPFTFFERVLPYTDLFLFDIKHMNSDSHKEYTGVDNKLILNNIKKLAERDCEIWIRIPSVPDCNATEHNLEALCNFISDIQTKAITRIYLLPYHKLSSHKYDNLNMTEKLAHISEPTTEQMEEWQKIFKPLNIKTYIKG